VDPTLEQAKSVHSTSFEDFPTYFSHKVTFQYALGHAMAQAASCQPLTMKA